MLYSKGYTPEPPLEPPEDDRYMIADCGHEVYEGENMYEWDVPYRDEDGKLKYKHKTHCPDCFMDEIKKMLRESPAELAEWIGIDYRKVEF